jgi:bifunctional DNA-binding transcriptional regulator/antitoxin component of YhaV-PrlF toxin-antitoxin module
MSKYLLPCLLLGALAWGQAASTKPASNQNSGAATSPAPQAAGQQNPAAANPAPEPPKVALDAAVITITGMCDHPSANQSADATCKTVITRAEFEKVIDAVQPSMPPRSRRSFADRYARTLVMAHKAEEMGLDKSANYDERMRLARIQVLSQELGRALQEKAAQISDKDIEDYYRANQPKFEQAELERVYIPKAEQPMSFETDKKAGETADEEDRERDKRDKAQTEQAMKDEADKLRARAAGGEDFAKLQTEAFTAAGIKAGTPNVDMGKTRRVTLPATQVSVMDMKPGEISGVIADQNGYFIYKLKSKSVMTLDQARDEIKGTLRSQRLQDENSAVQQSATPALDETYFGPEMQRGPMPGMPMPPQPAKPTPPGPK